MMQISTGMSISIILVMAVATFVTRAAPFLLFPDGKEVPEVVRYLGKSLPPAVIGLLVVFCLKDIELLTGSHGLPEILSIMLIVLLHRWKRHNLLSIGGGTVFYMILIRLI